MPSERAFDRDVNVNEGNRMDFDNAENDGSALRRELYRTKRHDLERGGESTPASPARQLPPAFVAPPPFSHRFKIFHLELLEHLYEKEMGPRASSNDAATCKDTNDAASNPSAALRTELSLARKFLGDLPQLVAQRFEATRLVKIHEEAESLCVAPENVSRKRPKTTHPTSNSRADHLGGRGREQESSSSSHSSTPPILSPSFRIVEHLLGRQAEHAANAWACRQASSVTPLVTMVRRRIESLQGVQKDQHDQEMENAQRLIEKLLSTNPNRATGANDSPAFEPGGGINGDSYAMTTALKLRLWDLLRRDLEALSAHE